MNRWRDFKIPVSSEEDYREILRVLPRVGVKWYDPSAVPEYRNWVASIVGLVVVGTGQMYCTRSQSDYDRTDSLEVMPAELPGYDLSYIFNS
jgi:hypothetical protein